MGAALVQLFLCLVAGYVLWRLWRAFDGEDRFVRTVVFIGFLGRAVAGFVLFWISYLRLPVARSLQVGDGLWFFALDAKLYLPNASEAARQGVMAILQYNRGAASVTYVQTLAFFALLFGIVASVALLLNLFCYLGSCLILAKLRNATPAAKIPGAVAIAAISLSPSAMLWSLQPLKDTLFQFLIVAFVAACVVWQRAWRLQPAPLLAVTAAAVMFASMFAMGGIRWYFAFSVLCATFAFLVLIGVLAARRKALALVAGAILFATLTQAFVLGAGPYTPPRLLDLFSLSRPGANRIAALSPIAFIKDLRHIRGGFERAGGATSIGVGGKLARLEQHPPQPVPQIASAPVQPAAQPRPQLQPPPQPPPATTTEEEETAEETEEPVATTTTAEPRVSTPAATESVASAAPAPAKAPPAKAAPTPAPAVTQTAASHVPAPAHPVPAPAPAPATTQGPAVAASTPAPAPAPPVHPPAVTATTTTTPGEQTAVTPVAERPARKVARPKKKKTKPQPVKTAVSQPPATTTTAVPAPVPATATASAPVPAAAAPVAQPAPEPQIVLPESTTVRLMTGAIAVLVPRTIASSQGLLDIRGGKGLFWFTDLDTVAFDIIMLFALFFCVRRFRWATLRNPSFWFVGVLMLLVGVPLIYTITNFGTLFRLRMMVYTCAALLPLALAMATVPPEPEISDRSAEPEPVRPEPDARSATSVTAVQ